MTVLLHQRRLRDGILATACAAASLLVLGIFAWLLTDLVRTGWGVISPDFVAGEVTDAGRAGGIGPVLVSTLLILMVCMIAALPPGIATAVWLTEFAPPDNLIAHGIRIGIDVLASVPSIVFGLFGMVFFCQVLGLGFSIAAGGLTLACMVLPVLVHTTVSGLLAAPHHLRPAAAALGMSRVRTIRSLLLPAALPGMLVGFTLGIARALAETAALIFTSGYATRWPTSLSDSGRSISVHIYDLAMNVPGGGRNAAGSALLLLALLLVINLAATALSDAWLRKRFDHET